MKNLKKIIIQAQFRDTAGNRFQEAHLLQVQYRLITDDKWTNLPDAQAKIDK